MKAIINQVRRCSSLTLAAIAFASVLATPATAEMTVVARDASVLGASQADWTARWWQWILSLPSDKNPGLDNTGALCRSGQSGSMWYLAGTFSGGAVSRTCTVPFGRHILIPVATVAFGSGVFDCDPTVEGVLCNTTTLRRTAFGASNNVTMSVTLDDVAVPNLRGRRISSETFEITLPPNNLLGVNPGTYSPQVSDGYWLIVSPPAKGTHTVQISATFNSGPFAGSVVDVSYELTVQ